MVQKMIHNSISIHLFRCSLFLLLINSTCGQQSEQPWEDYLGSHRDIEPWARSTRGVAKVKLGFDLIPEIGYLDGRIDTVHSLFSSKSRTVLSLNDIRLTHFLSELDQQLKEGDVIVPIGGWFDKGKRFESLSIFSLSLEQDPYLWADHLYEQVRQVLSVQTENQIIFQIGNEINSKRKSSLYHLAMQDQKSGKANDSTVISPYVEFYLLPTIAAIRQAIVDASLPQENAPKILLGTIANARNAESIEWLETLLEYRVQGATIPQLKSEPVWSMVDYIGIHYLLTSRSNGEPVLDSLKRNWLDSNRLEGIWLTEEGGKTRGLSNQGARTALHVFSEYFEWVNENSLNPDQTRCFFWGRKLGIEGTSMNDGLMLIHDLLDNSYLLLDPTLSIKLNGQPQSDVNIFATKSVLNKTTGFLAIITTLQGLSTREFMSLELMLNKPIDVIGRFVYLLGNDGLREIPVISHDGESNVDRLEFAEQHELTEYSSILLFIKISDN